MVRQILSLCLAAVLASQCIVLGGASEGARQAEAIRHLEAEVAKTRQQVQKEPGNSLYNLQLGTLLQQLDFINPDGGRRIPEAEAAYRKAIEMAPDSKVKAGIYGNLGALLIGAQGRLEDALECTEQATALGIEASMQESQLFAGTYFNRGKILGMLGREAASQEAYREAAEVSHGVSPGSWAKALTALNDYSAGQAAAMEEAALYLRLSEEEGQGEAEEEEEEGQPASSRRRRRGAQKKGLEELRADWAWLDDMNPEDRPWLFFGLYRALYSTGEAAKAWPMLEKANRLQRSMFNYDMQDEVALVDGLVTGFHKSDPGMAHVLSGDMGTQDATPIFVVGLPRSGSSLIEQVIASHPKAFGAGEDTAFAPLLPELFQILKGQGRGALRTPRDVGEAYVAAMRRRAPPGVSRIVDKMLRNNYNVGYAQIVLPRACVIHAVRHPLDVALSCFAQPFEGRGLPWASNLTEIAQAVRNNARVMAHWDAQLPGKVLHVPYEGVVADLEGWARRMLAHCGLPWDPAVLEYYQNERSVLTASVSQVRRKLYKSSVGKWRVYEEQLLPVAEALQLEVAEYERTFGVQSAPHGEL